MLSHYDESKSATHPSEIWDACLVSQDVPVSFLGRELFTQDASRLRACAEMIAKDPTLCQAYVDLVLASKIVHENPNDDRVVTTTASNAISVLNYGSRSGIFPFRFIDVRDWSGIRVPHANLNYAVMAHCDLSDADLSGSSIINITLFGAQLSRANLSGVKAYEVAVFQRAGHQQLSIHANGYIAATVISNEVIRIFNLETDEDLAHLRGHTSTILTLNFSGDGSYLGSISTDRTVRIWNMTSYNCTIVQLASSGTIRWSPIRFSPDNHSIAIIWNSKVFCVANLEVGRWRVFDHAWVHDIVWSPNTNRILSYTQRGEMCIWDVETRECKVKWHVESSDGCSVKFTPDGTKIVVNATDEVFIYNAATGDFIAKIPTLEAQSVVFAVDHRHAYVSSSCWIFVFDLETHECTAKYLDMPSSYEVFSVADGQRLIAYCKATSTLRIFDPATLKLCVPTISKQNFTDHFSYAFSPDNRQLVASYHGSDGELKFIDTTTGPCTGIASTEGYNNEIYLLSYSSTGRFIAYVGFMGETVTIYDVEERKCIKSLEGSEASVICILFSPKGNLLASSSLDCDSRRDENGDILLWNTETWERRVLHGYTSSVHHMCFSPDGNILASLSDRGSVRMWDVNTRECVRIVGDASACYTYITYSPCGRFLATLEHDRHIRIWNTVDGTCVTTLRESIGENQHFGIYFLVNGRILSATDGYRVFDLTTGESTEMPFKVGDPDAYMSSDCTLFAARVAPTKFSPLYLWHFAEAWESRVVFTNVGTSDATTHHLTCEAAHKDGCALISLAHHDGTIQLHTTDMKDETLSKLEGHSDLVTCMHASSNSPLLVSGSRDHTVRLWNLESQQSIAELAGHKGAVSCVCLSPDNQYVVSGSYDMTICIWNVEEAKCINQFKGHTTPIRQVVWSPDNTSIASIGTASNVIYLWDATTNTCSKILDKHTAEVFGIQYSCDGAYLASGSHDDTVCIWETKTGECIATLQGHTDCLTCFSLSSDGRTAVSGSEDHTIRVWNVSTGECNFVIRGHTHHIRGLCVTPDNRCIISASNDHVIHIWDLNTGAMLHQLLGHTDAVTSIKLVNYDADGGSSVISTSGDGIVRLWTIARIPVRVSALPELRSVIGAQECMDFCDADLTDAITDSSSSTFIDYYRTAPEYADIEE